MAVPPIERYRIAAFERAAEVEADAAAAANEELKRADE